ncbi:Fe-S cluster assembly protein SufD [Reinekea sp.]|uniref:Fe-S cluster assembly protein SufD n=1 Tax=Reinekea sp. TaxID=1970455 RepID=UPI003989B3AC
MTNQLIVATTPTPVASENATAAHWAESAASRFAQLPWPTRKTEHWKYTPLKALLDAQWQKAPAKISHTGVVFEDFNEVTITIENGHLQGNPALPKGVSLKCLSKCTEAETTEFLEKVAAQKTDFMFDELNASLLDEGYWLTIEKNAQVTTPIHFNFVTNGNANIVNTQILVDAQPSSSAVLVESFKHESGSVFVNPNTTLYVEENAQLTHYHLLLDEGDVRHIGRVAAVMQRSSKLESFHMAVGGVVKRKDIVVRHCGEGGELILNGVYLPKGNEHIDYHTILEHEVPHCTSQEVFRGIIGDSATAVFNGRIHIHKDAQKSLAELSNRNLLLSDKATIYTKPELEIYADDVKCAHGATIAQLDESELFYFLSRGVSRAEAEVMLSFGFINELLDALPHDPVRQLLRPLLAQVFSAKSGDLTRHLV